MKYLLFLLALLPITSSVRAQMTSEEAIQQLQTIYEALNDAIQNIGQKAFHLEYEVRSAYHDPAAQSIQTVKEAANLYAYGNKAYYYGDQGAILQDHKNIVTVNHKDQQIQIFKNPKGRKSKPGKWLDIQSKLFAVCEVETAQDTVLEGKTYSKIKLRLPEQYRNAQSFRDMVFVVDFETAELKAITINYTPENALVFTEYRIKSINYNYEVEQLHKNALSLIYKNDALAPDYSGYQVQDYR